MSDPVDLSKGSVSGGVGKGRPTPKRSEKERRRGGPVAPPPTTRKEAAKRLRAQQAAGRKDRRAGYSANEERVLLKRDAGPVRSLVRDVVDSRRNVGVLLLPLAVLVVVSGVDPTFQRVANVIWSGGILAMLLDSVLLAVRVRSRVKERFPDDRRTGRHMGYALLRSTVLRRFRMPPPKVAPGQPV